MIVYANGKIIATDAGGNTQPVGAAGIAEKQDELKMSGQQIEGLLLKLLKESIKTNMYLSFWTDINITNHDVEV